MLHGFGPHFSHGANPSTGVVADASGSLYGVSGPNDYGSVSAFKLTQPETGAGSWLETSLHRFTGNEAEQQMSGLVLGKGGVLYGTTYEGGAIIPNSRCAQGCGTVYRLVP